MRRPIYNFIIIAFVFLGCSNPKKEELMVINKLNEKYSKYEFSPGTGPIGTHLNLNLKDANWDSLSLKMMYDSSILTYGKSPEIPWVYLNVNDSSGKYLFTIVKDEASGYVFFRDQ
jgi:hypothetical protein